jgi:adenylate cyclase
VLLACLAVLAADPAPLLGLRNLCFDAYQRALPRERKSAPVTIVEIDERALDARGQWPWPRALTAELVRAIGSYEPAAIGIDILFAEPDRSEPDADAKLAAAIAGEKVVLGMAGLEQRDRRYPFPPQSAPWRLASMRELPVRSYDGHLQSRPEIQRAAAGRALLSVDAPDQVVRRVPMVARVGNTYLPGLSVEMVRGAAGARLYKLEDLGGERLRIVIGDLQVPVQSDGGFWVRFGRHDAQRFVSAEEVLLKKAPRELLEAKLVLVGVTGLGLLDYKLTPLGEQIPGVEIHAQVLEQIFDGSYLRRPARAGWIDASLLLVAGMVLILAVPRLRPWRSAAVLGVLVAALAASGLVAFGNGVLLNVAAPLAGALLLYGTLVAATLAESDRQRRLLREAQARVAGELAAARRIQMGLLPAPARLFAHERRFELEALLEPARTVGGDFYDCFMLDAERAFFVVADVSGKGLAASLFMALSKSLLKSIVLQDARSPAEALSRASREIGRENTESLFVTAFAGVLDLRSGRLEFCNAGHEPPLAFQPGHGVQRLLESGGPPLCVMADYRYEGGSLQMAPGAWLCVVTDGVTEAMNERGDLYGSARLATLLSKQAGEPKQIIHGILDDVKRFAGNAEQSDDLTLLCLRWNGASAR